MPTPPAAAPRILVVDDEPALTRTVKLVLEQAGRYQVQTLNDPHLAVQTAREFQPDLIILDVMMPGKDGGEVAADLRDNSVTRRVPIVFLTAAVQGPEVDSRGGVIGGFPFIAKPVNKATLIQAIEENLPAAPGA
jgi:CheY-like chemotaxis protein